MKNFFCITECWHCTKNAVSHEWFFLVNVSKLQETANLLAFGKGFFNRKLFVQYGMRNFLVLYFFAKSSILDVWQVSEHTSAINYLCDFVVRDIEIAVYLESPLKINFNLVNDFLSKWNFSKTSLTINNKVVNYLVIKKSIKGTFHYGKLIY